MTEQDIKQKLNRFLKDNISHSNLPFIDDYDQWTEYVYGELKNLYEKKKDSDEKYLVKDILYDILFQPSKVDDEFYAIYKVFGSIRLDSKASSLTGKLIPPPLEKRTSFKFESGDFYECKPTAIYLDLFRDELTYQDEYYYPPSNVVYAEFNNYDEFRSKDIYRAVFKQLKIMGKTWRDLDYAISIDNNWDENTSDITIIFGKTRQRSLEYGDYKTDTILFGFSIDMKDYEQNAYGDSSTFCHNAETGNKSFIYWCGIPYSEGSMAVGNFCTHIVYDPRTLTFGIDGDCA